MNEQRREFGLLLTQGLKSIAARQHKGLGVLEDELGYELGVTGWAIQGWRQDRIPPHPGQVCSSSPQMCTAGRHGSPVAPPFPHAEPVP